MSAALELNGNTSVLPLFDVVQMLSVNDATGMLRVETGAEKGYLYFQGGTVINALDDERREGEAAAKRVFGLADADFRFSPELPSVAHAIRCSTQSLMMEIARQLDEESLGDPEATSHGDRVREAQAASEKLNEIFQQLDQDSKILGLRSRQGIFVSDLVNALGDAPEAVLYLREGAVPEVADSAGVRPVGETRVDAEGFGDLLEMVAGGHRLPGTHADGVEVFRRSLGSLGNIRVERTRAGRDEIVTIRRQPDSEAAARALPVPAERLDAFCDPAGSIVLLTAPSPGILSAAFGAAAARASGRFTPFVGLARRWPDLPPRGAAFLLSALQRDERDQFPDLVDRFSPALVAVEDGADSTAAEGALRALRAGARAIVGVCAPSPVHALPRLLQAVPDAARRSWLFELGRGLTAIVDAEGNAAQPDDAVRAALMSGDVAPLAAFLAGQ